MMKFWVFLIFVLSRPPTLYFTDNNIQSNAPYRQVLTTQLHHLASLPKWLNVRLWTKWLWVRVPLQSVILCEKCPNTEYSLVRIFPGMWVSEMSRWDDSNIQSRARDREVLTTQLNQLTSLAKWLSVCLQTKWLWVLVPLQSVIL